MLKRSLIKCRDKNRFVFACRYESVGNFMCIEVAKGFIKEVKETTNGMSSVVLDNGMEFSASEVFLELGMVTMVFLKSMDRTFFKGRFTGTKKKKEEETIYNNLDEEF